MNPILKALQNLIISAIFFLFFFLAIAKNAVAYVDFSFTLKKTPADGINRDEFGRLRK